MPDGRLIPPSDCEEPDECTGGVWSSDSVMWQDRAASAVLGAGHTPCAGRAAESADPSQALSMLSQDPVGRQHACCLACRECRTESCDLRRKRGAGDVAGLGCRRLNPDRRPWVWLSSHVGDSQVQSVQRFLGCARSVLERAGCCPSKNARCIKLCPPLGQ